MFVYSYSVCGAGYLYPRLVREEGTAHGTGARSGLRVIDGGAVLNDSVERLHRFQGEHTEARFTAPHMGGHGRYIAVIPVGAIPGESREITVTSLDLTGLMDQLDDLLPSGPGAPGQSA